MTQANSTWDDSVMFDAAHVYIGRGWLVFPVHTPLPDGSCSCQRDCGRNSGKHPRTAHGVLDATTDSQIVEEWWSKWPQANIGIATGAGSGLVVIDVDGRAGGWQSVRGLEEEYGHLPIGPKVVTGSGGGHLYFRHPGIRVPNSVGKLGPGLDIRGDGGYVVAPPSLHCQGERYRWEIEFREDVGCPVEPVWLMELYGSVNPPLTKSIGGQEITKEGRRNAVLTSLAGTMRRRGFSSDSILAALLVENIARCQPPLADEEVRRIAQSVSRYTPAAPVSTRSWRGLRVREVRRG